MLLVIDAHYKETYAKVVGILYNSDNEIYQNVITETIKNVKPYVSGEFYKRELPCILRLLKQVDLNNIEVIIVDGHVYVNNDKDFGLGGHLWKTLKGKTPIIGVAKRKFYGNDKTVVEIFRGNSKNPLYISSIGIDLRESAEKIKSMKGDFRIPNILKTLDQITKQD